MDTGLTTRNSLIWEKKGSRNLSLPHIITDASCGVGSVLRDRYAMFPPLLHMTLLHFSGIFMLHYKSLKESNPFLELFCLVNIVFFSFFFFSVWWFFSLFCIFFLCLKEGLCLPVKAASRYAAKHNFNPQVYWNIIQTRTHFLLKSSFSHKEGYQGRFPQQDCFP